MKPTLKKIHIDDYIWDEFVKFVYIPGNGVPQGSGMRLKEGVEFSPGKITNRNPMVCSKLWRKILFSHLKTTYFN